GGGRTRPHVEDGAVRPRRGRGDLDAGPREGHEMLRRRKFLGAVGAVGVAFGVWLGYEHWAAPKGPTYKSKTADKWRAELRHWQTHEVILSKTRGPQTM